MSSDKDKLSKDAILNSEEKPIIPKKQGLRFEDFLNFFPVIDLPYSISSDTARLLSEAQEPLSYAWMERFVLSKEEVEAFDEYTEYMACFSLPKTESIYALVYWTATLHGSSYYLASFSRTGVLINRMRIAGMEYGEKCIRQRVCTIQDSLTCSIMEGDMDAQTGKPLPLDTGKQSFYQLNQDGELVEL